MQELPKPLAEAIRGALASLPVGEPMGSVYVVCAGGLYWKVGRAGDPNRRVANMQSACPYPLHLATAIPHATPYLLEAEIQSRLVEWCHFGEWFKFDRPAVELADDANTLTLMLLCAIWQGVLMHYAAHAIQTQRNLDRIKAEGRKPGRRPMLTPESIAEARELLGSIGLMETAKRMGVSESTIRRHVMRASPSDT